MGLRWRECSICEMFLSWSMMVSTMARLRSRILSINGMGTFFMLERMPVTGSTPKVRKRSSRSALER